MSRTSTQNAYALSRFNSTTRSGLQAIDEERRVIYRTRGRGYGPIVRLMSPSDLGRELKPFVFLDLFEVDMRQLAAGMPMHPHSGIATITVPVRGDMKFDDPQAGQGTLGYGGVEWSRAGGGMWHGKELSAGTTTVVQGFQLWIALPPELENGEAAIELSNPGRENAIFVLGSALPHNHPLHLGYYSVHTSAEALAAGEERIAELGRRLAAAGDRRTASGTVPVFR